MTNAATMAIFPEVIITDVDGKKYRYNVNTEHAAMFREIEREAATRLGAPEKKE